MVLSHFNLCLNSTLFVHIARFSAYISLATKMLIFIHLMKQRFLLKVQSSPLLENKSVVLHALLMFLQMLVKSHRPARSDGRN